MNKPEETFYDKAREIDRLLSAQFTDSVKMKLFNITINDSAATDYFLKKVASTNWFYPLKERQFFAPHKAPSPKPADQGGYFIPEWNILPYLEKISQQVATPGNEIHIDELLKIIEEVSNYRNPSGQHIDNYRTWWYFVKILINLPNEKIDEEIINLIPIWLDSQFDTMLQGSEIATKLLPKFLTGDPEDIKKAEKIIESITTVKILPVSGKRAEILGEKEEKKLVVASYWLKETFDKYSKIIGEKCSKRVIEDLANKIRGLLKREQDGTYESFYEESEYPTDDPLRVLTSIFKRVLLVKAKTYLNTTEGILGDFLKDKYLFFPKMAIYVIGQTIDHYTHLFWETMESETGVFIMGNALYFGDELKHLLKNLKLVSDKQRKILKTKIEQGAKCYPFKEDIERNLALCKQEIYEALSHDAYFKDLYEEMKKITNVDTELHPAVGKVITRWGPGRPPLKKEEILKMGNRELADFLKAFKTKDSWQGPTVGGLADTLKEAVKENSNKFTEDLSFFDNLGFIYVYRILDGIKDAWKEKKTIDWNKVFDFITLYTKKDQFWEDELVVEKGEWLGGADHEWVTGIIAELIQEGTRDDSWAFSEEHFDKAKEIIFDLLREPEEDSDINDYVTYTLNTPCGKLITCLIYLSLRIARVNDKKGIKVEPKWEREYKNKYDEMLEKGVIEAYTNLGRFLPNLSYLDKNWAYDNVRGLASESGKRCWEAFMDGYLSIGTVYDDLYELTRAHYQYALSYDFKNKRNREHLIEHICIGYLRDHERIDDPNNLFRKIIDAWKHDQIKEIIGFFWMQRNYLREASEENEEIKKKIIEFWKVIYERYKDKDEKSFSHEDKLILSSISELAALLPSIDAEFYKWLMLSAPHVNEDFRYSFFIEYLDEIKDKGENKETAKYIGEIYLKMLERGTPDHDKKHIRSIVEFLYDAGAQEYANKICNIYGSRGSEFLRDIYEKFNTPK
jgi:hypothetical protein